MTNRVYVDFDLLLERSGEKYRARVLNSPAGPASTEFVLPYSDDKLENFILRISQGRRTVRNLKPVEIDASREFGSALFEALFNGDVEICLRNSITSLDPNTQSLRLRLRLSEAPELVDIPWEYLYDSANRRFLALSVDTPLVRYLDLPGRITPLTVKPPLNVLVMISSPTDVVQLDVEQEWNKLKSAVADLEQQGMLRLDRLEKATLEELQQRLRRDDYHIFHFIGHGGFDPKDKDGVLMLEDEQGRAKAVSGQILGTLLHDEKTLRLALLNACEGGRTSKTDPFAGVGQSLLQQGVPAVIAMQFEVTDDTAITLAHAFYSALADGYSVDAALTEARKTIFARNALEWGTPVLYMRSPDGRIFDVTSVDPAVKTQNQIATLLSAGQAAIKATEWGKAEELFNQVLKLEPTNSAAANGLTLVRQSQSTSSPIFTSTIKSFPTMGVLYSILGVLLVAAAIYIVPRLVAGGAGSQSEANSSSQVGDTTTPTSSPTALATSTSTVTPSSESTATATTVEPTLEAPTALSGTTTLPPVEPISDSAQLELPTSTPIVTPTDDPNLLYALAPEIEFSLFSDREISSSIVRKLRPSERLLVLEVDEEWAKVETTDGQSGWIRSRFYTYEGNGERLPIELRMRLVSARNDLPFVYAEVISFGGATGDYLLRDPNDELSGFRFITVSTNVTVLQIAEGAKSYASGQWCFVSVVDPENPLQLLNGWLPLDVLKQRESPNGLQTLE